MRPCEYPDLHWMVNMMEARAASKGQHIWWQLGCMSPPAARCRQQQNDPEPLKTQANSANLLSQGNHPGSDLFFLLLRLPVTSVTAGAAHAITAVPEEGQGGNAADERPVCAHLLGRNRT